MSEDMLALPIDQYGRQKWVSIYIDWFRNKHQTLKILDVGGYKGKTAEFQPNDVVTICDLFDIDEPGYVQTDGKVLPFDDNSFDFSVSFDTFEHVPRANRSSFIRELGRVSKTGFLLAAPFDDDLGKVSKAERDLNNYHELLYNTSHPWLKEHIEYKIPKPDEIEKILTKEGLYYYSFATNDLAVWIVMQTLYFSIELDTDFRGRVDLLNRTYNQNLVSLDTSLSTGYRRIYFATRSKESVKKIREMYKEITEQPDKKITKEDFLASALSTLGVKYRDVVNHDLYLEKELKDTREANRVLQEQNQHLNEKAAKITKSIARRAVGAPRRIYRKAKKGST